MAKLSTTSIQSWTTDPRLVTGRSNQKSGIAPLQPQQTGIPQPVTKLTASSTRVTVGGAQVAKVNVTHQTSSSDQAFHHTNLWVSGYLGNPNPQLLGGGITAPHTLALQPTGEQISITAQSVGRDGSLLPMAQSPKTAVTL